MSSWWREAESPEGAQAARRRDDAALPARAIVLCIDDDAGARPQGSRIEATVESNLVAHPEGGRLVYSEQITLIGPPGCEPHFGALVRGFGIPGIPTAVFWLEPALAGPALARELLPLADRVVLDSTACFRPQQLFDLNGLTTRAQPVPVADLGWLRFGGLRSLFAGLFDPPVGGGPLAAATRLEIRHLTGSEAPALLFAAWLGVRLGWRPLRVTAAAEGGIRCEVARNEAAVETLHAQLTPADGPCGRSGILSVTLEAGNHRFSIHRTALDETRLESTFAPLRVVKLDSYSDAELAVAALGPRGRDPLFARCLAFARELWTVDATTDPAARILKTVGAPKRNRASSSHRDGARRLRRPRRQNESSRIRRGQRGTHGRSGRGIVSFAVAGQRPKLGERAPDFTLPGPGGTSVHLADLLGKGPLVVYFYPKDETAGCTAEACAFRDAYEDFGSAGAQVVGISRDDPESHRRFAAHHRLPFLLLSDPTGEVHDRYGVASRLGGILRDRVTFVLDREGVVRHVFSSGLRMRAHVDESLAIVRRLAG